jgi:hypothetical protein
VTDFGLATFEIRMDDFEGGAPVWSAPELLEKRGDASRAGLQIICIFLC